MRTAGVEAVIEQLGPILEWEEEAFEKQLRNRRPRSPSRLLLEGADSHACKPWLICLPCV